MFTKEDLIYAYTTKQALEDGVLFKVEGTIPAECGITVPVYMTAAVWHKYVEVPKGMEGEQDQEGRLWDVIYMFAFAMKAKLRQQNPDSPKLNLIHFEFICRLPDKGDWESNEKRSGSRLMREVNLKAILSNQDIDDPSPALFILKPMED